MRPIPKEKVGEIFRHHKNGVKLMDISKLTGVNYHTLRGIIRKKLGGVRRVSKEELEDLHQRMIADRMTMCIGEVAEKYERSIRYVSYVTKDHPEKHLFKRKLTIKKPKAPKPVKKAPKPAKQKQVKPKAEPKMFRSDGMEKGHIKLKRDEKVLPTKVYDRGQQRAVPLNDGRNTLIFVNINDPRTNDEVRRAFIEKNEREYQSLKSSKIDQSKKQREEVTNGSCKR